jgi:hypothetical protein
MVNVFGGKGENKVACLGDGHSEWWVFKKPSDGETTQQS